MLAVSCTGSNEGGKFFFLKVACRCGPCNCWAINCRKTQIWRIALNHWGFISKEQTWHILFLPDYQPFSLLVHYCGLPPSLMTIFYLIWQSLMTKWSKSSKSRIAQKWRVWKMWPVRFLLIGCTVLILTLWQWEGNWVSFWPAMLPHWSLKGLIGKWRQQLNLGQCPLHDMVSLGRTGCTQFVSVIISSVKK